MSQDRPVKLVDLAAALAAGGLLTLMVHFNGELGRYGGAVFSSWSAHGTGTVAALLLILILRSKWKAEGQAGKAIPLWAYLGGLSGALTVMATSSAVNSPLALSGTLALGLGGQVVFSLAADHWGLLGLPKRRPGLRDFAALALVMAGSAVIILFGLGT